MHVTSEQRSGFVKLADPSGYLASPMDVSIDGEARDHWVPFFKRHLLTILKLGCAAAVARGESEQSAQRRAELCREEFYDYFDEFLADPTGDGRHGHQRVTILTLDQWRDMFLRRHGFIDAFIDLKERENQSALPLLPAICREIDALPEAEQIQALVEGIFAGNIFDMGAEATSKAFMHGGPDFDATRRSLSPRPWLIDDFDALRRRFLQRPLHRKVVFFIDNAGSDFLLGAIPMVRWLARRGTEVVLAANQRPTLNDMTIGDVNAWWPRIVETEPSLKNLPIQRVSTGTGEPLIDLSDVSEELNAASADADLVILEGMGRGVESNLDVQLTCDVANLAMIKDLMVAKRCGGKLYDVVCRFTLAAI